MEMAVFALFALLALGSAVVVIAHRNPVYSTMSLVVTLISLAAMFVLLGAPFIAALQVLIYTGAILVLFLFVIMLLNVAEEEIAESSRRSLQRWGAGFGALVLAAMLGLFFWQGTRGATQQPLTEEFVALKSLALELFGEYLLPFEIVGVLLLVAVIAATVLARKPPAPAPAPAESTEPASPKTAEEGVQP